MWGPGLILGLILSSSACGWLAVEEEFAQGSGGSDLQ